MKVALIAGERGVGDNVRISGELIKESVETLHSFHHHRWPAAREPTNGSRAKVCVRFVCKRL
jgi:hypothetical protein